MKNTLKSFTSGTRRLAQRGFTMVELAIVLVVAGLILVAVLKGTDTINKAKVERAVADLKGLQGMILETQKRINRLPGDCDNNGVIATLLPVQRTFLSSNGSPIVDAVERNPANLQVGGAPNTTGTLISTTANETCDTAGGSAVVADASNFVYNEMRRSGVVDGHRTNMELAQHSNQDVYLIGAMQDAATPKVRANVIVMYGIPVWLAEAIDAEIDGVSQDYGVGSTAASGPAQTGRVRRWDNLMNAGSTGATTSGSLPYLKAASAANGQYNAGPLNRDDLISISYQFDTIKLNN